MRSVLVACGLVLVGCEAAPRAAGPIDVAITAPVRPRTMIDTPESPPGGEEAVEIVPSGDPIPPLPPTWSAPAIPSFGFVEALQKGRRAKESYERLGPPKSTSEADLKGWFVKAGPLVDLASRMYATAFYATDASRDGRIDAIAEAAELELALALRLDEVGLLTMPASWQSNPSIRATFEDVATGPMRRWRDEARALARSCLTTAKDTGVATDAVRRCTAIRTVAPAAATARPSAPCGCTDGDPLCSASLGGWCPR